MTSASLQHEAKQGASLALKHERCSRAHVSTRSCCVPGMPPPQAMIWPLMAATARLPRSADIDATGTHSPPSDATLYLP